MTPRVGASTLAPKPRAQDADGPRISIRKNAAELPLSRWGEILDMERPQRTYRVKFIPNRPNDASDPAQYEGWGHVFLTAASMTLTGKKRRPHSFGRTQRHEFSFGDVVNVERDGLTIKFHVKTGPDKTTVRSYEFQAESDEAAAAIEAALPAVQTAEFSQATSEWREFHERLRAATPHVFVTPTLMAINVVIFVVMVFAGAGVFGSNLDLYVKWGANFAPLTTGGEWWRLFTSTFLHFGVLHLAVNMWALNYGGRLVERLFGNMLFAVIYVFAGLTGSLTSLFWHGDVVSAGASGAIFGMYGSLLAYIVCRRGAVPRKVLTGLRFSTVGFLAFSLFGGFTSPGVDNAAHLGGLAGGLAMGFIVARPLDRRSRTESKSGASTILLTPAASRFAHAEQRSRLTGGAGSPRGGSRPASAVRLF